jgi:hypothetical protein
MKMETKTLEEILAVPDGPVEWAYQRGYYVDKSGVTWRKGMDGWFMEHDSNDIILIRHGDMEKIIEKEHDANTE